MVSKQGTFLPSRVRYSWCTQGSHKSQIHRHVANLSGVKMLYTQGKWLHKWFNGGWTVHLPWLCCSALYFQMLHWDREKPLDHHKLIARKRQKCLSFVVNTGHCVQCITQIRPHVEKPNMRDYNLKYVGCFSFLHEFWGIAVFPQLICMNIMQEKPEIPRFLVDSPDFHSWI